jgi:hypothetical protein
VPERSGPVVSFLAPIGTMVLSSDLAGFPVTFISLEIDYGLDADLTIAADGSIASFTSPGGDGVFSVSEPALPEPTSAALLGGGLA